ncbi:uncharacterized protein LOC119676473 [Teleopsis dalmanni]|uniref:uncharacterized protein LOC119676473 n=1 Tax=Teleopsis dalmanni TaxID=139649 RepID=UPI0018CD514F|nr:uncharacterized protein LOC119676473 [Teleopsis dalmanni]
MTLNACSSFAVKSTQCRNLEQKQKPYKSIVSSTIHIILLLCSTIFGIKAQSSYYKRTYYTPLSSPALHYFHHQPDYSPISYSSDLLPEESKRNEFSKLYGKKPLFRPYNSEEEETSKEHFANDYSTESHEYTSKENDNNEFTIGTQIHVQHPITVPKKVSSTHIKHGKYTSITPFKSSNSFSDPNLSTEIGVPDIRPKKHVPLHKYSEFDRDAYGSIGPHKASLTVNNGYNVFEPEHEDYEGVAAHLLSRGKPFTSDRFKGVASKKQIEKYLEDQQKLLDEALKAVRTEAHEPSLLSHPSAAAFRPNFDENISFKPNRLRRRPKGERPIKGKPNIVSKPKNRRFRSAILINA